MATPNNLRVGDTWEWTVELSDYPASTWTLSYALRGAGTINITAIADGNTHDIKVSSATTSTYTEGLYEYSASVSDGTDRYTIENGYVTIHPDLSTETGTSDKRTHAQIALDNIEAVLENRATYEQQSYSIAGRTLNRMSPMDLIKLKKYYQEEVNKGKPGYRTITTRLIQLY